MGWDGWVSSSDRQRQALELDLEQKASETRVDNIEDRGLGGGSDCDQADQTEHSETACDKRKSKILKKCEKWEAKLGKKERKKDIMQRFHVDGILEILTV